jgi:DNA/RNA endonuclease YhcR with UshA esterase domain
MRSLSNYICSLLVVAVAGAGEDVRAKVLTPAEASKKINEKVLVEMEVKSVGGKGVTFLNSEADYRDAKNFTLFIPKEAGEKFKKAKIEDPASYYKSKIVRASGTVVLYREKPEIKIEGPDQIKLVEKKPAPSPAK